MHISKETISKSSKCRLPKTFNPDKYNLNLIMDFYNLKYNLFYEMNLSVTDNQSKTGRNILILNAVDKYLIKNIYCFDKVSCSELLENDLLKNFKNFPKESNCFYFYSKDLIEIVNKFIFNFKGLEKYNEKYLQLNDEKLAKEKIKSNFIEYLQYNYMDSNNSFNNLQNIFNLTNEDFDFFDSLLIFAKNNEKEKELQINYNDIIKEQTIYIKLPRCYLVGESLNIFIDVEGDVKTEKSTAGFYLSIWGKESTILDSCDTLTIKEIWKDKYNSNMKDILLNSVFAMAGEPVDFRTVFPCFDEPCFKSKFLMNVLIPEESIIKDISENFQVLSNGELHKKIDFILENNHYIKYSFSESPLMSIYLLTWIIGYYKFISKELIIENSKINEIRMYKEKDYSENNSNTKSNFLQIEENKNYQIKIRSFYPLHRENESNHSLDIAEKSLQFYSEYFKIPYTFPKLDLVPTADFSYRALECWGCILFLHYALLVSPKLNILEKKLVSRTTVHEISHMWFGNLVTMEWWDDIWLNEGFARFMEFQCLNKIKPELNLENNFIELIFSQALKIDEKPSTHPVIGECASPDDLHEIFDTISYAKGASILRMFNHFIGSEKFMKVIQEYLKFYRFKNTKTINLWEMFLKYANIDLVEIMNSWTMKSGHPAIFVMLSNDYKDLIIEQYPFPRDFNIESFSGEEDLIWHIPLFIKTTNSEIKFLMKEKKISLNLEKDLFISNIDDLLRGDQFIKINDGMKGFYRVYYLNSEKEELNAVDYLKYIKYLNGLDKSDNNPEIMKFENIFKINKAEKNIFLNAFFKNLDKLTTIDISGLLEDYLAIKDLSTCVYILTRLGSLKETDYLILFYAEKIYLKITKILRPYLDFLNNYNKIEENSDYFNLENLIKQNNPFEVSKYICHLNNSIFQAYENLNLRFLKLINDNDLYFVLEKKISKDNFSIQSKNFLSLNENIENEYVDEFYVKMLNFISYISKFLPLKEDSLQDSIMFILNDSIQSSEINKESINKNLKFAIYNTSNSYKHLFESKIYDSENNKLYLQLLEEFSSNFYNLSLREKKSFYSILFNVDYTTCEKYFLFIDFAKYNLPLFRNKMNIDIYSILDGNNPQNIKILIDYKISLFFFKFFIEQNEDYKSIKNVFFDLFSREESIGKFEYSYYKVYFNRSKDFLIKAIIDIPKMTNIFDVIIIRNIIEYSIKKYESFLKKFIIFDLSSEEESNIENFKIQIKTNFEKHYTNYGFNNKKSKKSLCYILQSIYLCDNLKNL